MSRLLALLAGCLLGATAMAAPEDPMQTARSYFAEAEYASAARSFEEVLRAYPTDPVVLNNLAVARAANGQYQEAMELLERARQFAPYRNDIQGNLANLQEWMRSGADAGAPAGALVPPEPPPLWGNAAGAMPDPSANRKRKQDCQTRTCK